MGINLHCGDNINLKEVQCQEFLHSNEYQSG